MNDSTLLNYIQNVIKNMPSDWLNLTTHRLDIYNEELAKTQFLDQLQALYEANNSDNSALSLLPTAYDYIRLGHPLSCILEWVIANLNGIKAKEVISFSSRTTPILAVLRTNSLNSVSTRLAYTDELPNYFDAEVLRKVYGYQFSLNKINTVTDLLDFDGSTVLITQENSIGAIDRNSKVDFYVNIQTDLGSILIVNGEKNKTYISDIQHVRRRETIAMTPSNSLVALKLLVGQTSGSSVDHNLSANKLAVLGSIKSITEAHTEALVASSGLSIQYAIMMGLVDDAMENHPGKAIKFIVPPNCYGGTNDQARRVAESIENVEVVDLPVDGNNDMVSSVNRVLNRLALEDAVPYIIAEIPTNPRVEVPNLIKLKAALSEVRKTNDGKVAIAPVFILDQTFCPNVHFLGDGKVLSAVSAISYASGSKFPSGGKCTAGYCIGNAMAKNLMNKIEYHLMLCDNEATDLQYHFLAEQLPSMNARIKEAYINTRDFVNFIQSTLPAAKINFVSEELANQGFTPSVFSLDLPTKGNSDQEREAHKRELNLRLINKMITEIPNESKFCVSYGQLKGCYWTIPATSTQGTTKEGDKDYIVRASLSANMDLAKHKQVFTDFVNSL